MSGKGDCCDNAVAESFFATLKTELVADVNRESRSQAKREVTEYLNWYHFSRRRINNRVFVVELASVIRLQFAGSYPS